MAKKHKIRGFFVGEKGQRTFNYAYNIGASIVILGALFKVLHLPGADAMLILGMGTEACIFFLSAFDEPAKDYKWEKVYPELDMPNNEEAAIERLDRMKDRVSAAGTGTGVSAGGVVIIGNQSAPTMTSASTLTSAPSMPSMPDMSPALAQMGASLESLQESLKGLEQVPEFARQLEELNKNVQGLNAIYSLQLKSVSAGLGSIEQINQKNQELAQNLQQLNEAYSRMIAAMQGRS